MDKDFYKKMAQALSQMDEASKMDPVDHKQLKGTHAQRKDKDIDNDGKVDKSDEYLHNRRKAISKAMKKESNDDTRMGTITVNSDEERKKRAQAYRDKKGKAEVTMNTGTTGDKKGASMEQKESALPPVYARILEKRDMHYKGAMKQQPMDDNLPGAGAKKMVADMMNGATYDDTEEKGHKDVVKAGAPAAPVAKKRPNDNANGDKSVINPVKGMK